MMNENLAFMEAGYADMIQLPQLNEDTLLHNLEIRYESNLIYTYTGSILVAVNPYQLLPIYSMGIVRKYTGQRIGLLQPHIFAIADDSFRSMSEAVANQSIIISGESGAGKTETTKLILQFLSARTTTHTSDVEKKILESSPILEAFGNAKTGKYMEIHFDERDQICSARVIQYLLEKSRLVQQAESERNYHIFYQLLRAPDDQKANFLLQGKTASQFHYLNQSGCIQIDNVDDGEDFADVMNAFHTLGFSAIEHTGIFKILAAILIIGNVRFKLKTQGKGEASDVENPPEIEAAASLLSVPANELQTSLCQRINFIKGEKFTVPLSRTEAADNRDAFAKYIYASLFAWLVNRINQCIQSQSQRSSKAFIGVLDIFGFENFKINSFEQFCINFTNEKLQQHFNYHIFKLEQEEYQKEKISWSSLSFVDNQECIDLVEKKPLGIISLLDEECRFPKGTDFTWLEKLHQNYAKHPNYEQPRTNKETFLIRHYAGDVSYFVKGFLDKNRDTVQTELLELLWNSCSEVVTAVFAEEKMEAQKSAINVEDSRSTGRAKQGSSFRSVATRFKEQLSSLVQTLTATTPHYVRCIKPNTLKKPNNWDAELVMTQLRYAGMLETIKIRRLGYPIRYSFHDFFVRYRVLQTVDPKLGDSQKCQALISVAQLERGSFQVGVSKVFLKDSQKAQLEEARDRATTMRVIQIQKCWKRFYHRKRFLKLRQVTITMQRFTRGFLCRSRYKKKKEAILLLQSLERMRKRRKVFLRMRKSVVKMQKVYKGYQQRRKYTVMLQEKRKRDEDARLFNQQQLESLAADEAAARSSAGLQEAQQRQRIDEMKRAREEQFKVAEEERIAMERTENLKELGLLNDINNLEQMITKHDQPLAPKVDIENVADSDLLEMMADPTFFGEIEVPSFLQMKQDDGMEFSFLNNLSDSNDSSKGSDLRERANTVGTAVRLVTPKSEPHPIVLSEEIGNFSFKFFAHKYFREQKKKLKKPEDAYSWTKKPLTNSLLPDIPEDALKLAEQVSKKLMTFMYDIKPAHPQDIMTLAKYILQKGLTVEGLRDEIFSQLCKQLTANPRRESKTRGWELMCYCVSTFPPTDRLKPYLASFILGESISRDFDVCKEHATFAIRGLRRLLQNGTRKLPPSDIELRAISKRQPMYTRILLMDGSEKTLLVDSAATTGEVFANLIERINLKDATGFALFEVYNNIARKLAPNDNIGDTIAKSETLQKQMTSKGIKLSFNLLLKKSVFLSIKEQYEDLVERDLMYHQALSEITEGSLPCTGQEAMKLIALKLQMDYGDFDPNRPIDVTQCLPGFLYETRPDHDWVAGIRREHGLLIGMERGSAKDMFLKYAQELPLFGSNLFQGCKRSDKEPSPFSVSFDLAINAKGLHILNSDTKKILKTYVYGDLRSWACSDTTHVNIVAIDNTRINFEKEGEAVRIVGLLKEYSDAQNGIGWAKAKRTVFSVDDDILTFKEGDIIFIKEEDLAGWYIGDLDGRVGAVKEEDVEILVGDPAKVGYVINQDNGLHNSAIIRAETIRTKRQLKKATIHPDNKLVEQIKTIKKTLKIQRPASGTTGSPGTLRKLPEPPSEITPGRGSQGIVRGPEATSSGTLKTGTGSVRIRTTTLKGKAVDPTDRMRFQKEPISEPLLQTTTSKKEAKETFLLILKYMGDYPNKRDEFKVLQDLIEYGLKAQDLKDEIYCQLIKQTTTNPKRDSLIRGWVLIQWCSAIFKPGPDFRNFLLETLQASSGSVLDTDIGRLAKDSLNRLQKLNLNGNRKKPPSNKELTSAKNSSPAVERIFSIDGTRKVIYIHSQTTFKEAVDDLNSKYGLERYGFGLFEANLSEDTLMPLPDNDYVCDYISSWEKECQGKPIESFFKFVYKRKFLVQNASHDVKMMNSNSIAFNFVFHQILHDFRSGRLPPNSLEECVSLVALQLQIKNGDTDPQQISKIDILSLLPKHLKNSGISDDFIQYVHKERFSLKGINQQEAKAEFLRKLMDMMLYGACVFTVHVKSHKLNANKVWLCLTRRGVGVWDPFTREPRFFFTYDNINDWSSDQDSKEFTISTGSLLKRVPYTFSGSEAPFIQNAFIAFKDAFDKQVL